MNRQPSMTAATEQNGDTLDTLASIERVLAADRCGVREALEAAYKLGRIDGMLEILGGRDSVAQNSPAPPPPPPGRVVYECTIPPRAKAPK